MDILYIKQIKLRECIRYFRNEYEGILVEDYGDRIIVPGFVDLHVHAPQYAFRGLGMVGTFRLAETNTFSRGVKV